MYHCQVWGVTDIRKSYKLLKKKSLSTEVLEVDVAIPNDKQIRKEEQQKAGNQMAGVPLVIGALGDVSTKLEEWLQENLRTTSEMSDVCDEEKCNARKN